MIFGVAHKFSRKSNKFVSPSIKMNAKTDRARYIYIDFFFIVDVGEHSIALLLEWPWLFMRYPPFHILCFVRGPKIESKVINFSTYIHTHKKPSP